MSDFLCLYLDGYESLSSKYPGLHLLGEFLSELSFCYLLLTGSSSVLVTDALVRAPEKDGITLIDARVVDDNIDVVSRL